jgi:hypothetical protein
MSQGGPLGQCLLKQLPDAVDGLVHRGRFHAQVRADLLRGHFKEFEE